ncbi:MAG: hypothetical protein EP347_08275 [Alphaproteobacteria bacterium]|nr:MAG: hypothetical protein EP347_08275 [Alphaproteobacteria bacterium]
MRSEGFRVFLSRWLLALVMVFGTYNARGQSFYHLWRGDIEAHLSVTVLAGLVLVILFAICLKTTIQSIHWLGMIAAALVVATLIWVMSDYNLLHISNESYILYFGQIVLATVIAIGMSWGEVRNRR